MPLRGDVRLPLTTDDQRVPLLVPKEFNRCGLFIFRACVVASLVLSSSVMAGWKWDLAPH